MQTHSIWFDIDEETQPRRRKTFGVEEKRKESQASGLMEGEEEENQADAEPAEFQESMNEPQTSEFVGQTVKQNQPRKVSELREKMTKEENIFLPMIRTKSQMSRKADDASTRDLRAMLPPDEGRNQGPPEIRERSTRSTNKPSMNMPEDDEEPIGSDDQFWINMNEMWRAAHTRKEDPHNSPRKAPGQSPRKAHEPKVNPATALLRQQYADIRSKISPAKPATQKSKLISPPAQHQSPVYTRTNVPSPLDTQPSHPSP